METVAARGVSERGTRAALGVIAGLSAAVLAFLFWLIYFQEPEGQGAGGSVLPAFNALCNAVSATCVVLGLAFIKARRKTAHGIAMAGATLASALFLAGYIAYHNTQGHTVFTRDDWVRPLYLGILISHILLSVAVVPMVLSTLWFAVRRQWRLHRKFSRWTYPVWLYVSVTGVAVFLMLRWANGA